MTGLQREGWRIVNIDDWDRYYQVLLRKGVFVNKDIDPHRVPDRADAIPPMRKVLMEVMMSLGNRNTLQAISSEIEALSDTKGALYQDANGVDSCVKRGFFGVFQNLARKWDRFQAFGERYEVTAAAAEREAELDNISPEALRATLKDLAVYALHGMRYVEMFMEKPETNPVPASTLRAHATELAKVLAAEYSEELLATGGQLDAFELAAHLLAKQAQERKAQKGGEPV